MIRFSFRDVGSRIGGLKHLSAPSTWHAAGVRVDALSEDQALSRLCWALKEDGDGPLAVASINLDHVFYFGTSGRFVGTIDGKGGSGVSWLNLADGWPIVAKGRIFDGARAERITGSDILPKVLELGARLQRSVAFIGGDENLAARLSLVIADDYPQLELAGCWSPHRSVIDSSEASSALAREVAATQPDIVVVGLGKPRQELWIERYGRETNASLILAFGASAEFLAGSIKRAPKIFQWFGGEWLYRLALEPSRLARRYLVQGPVSAARLFLRR